LKTDDAGEASLPALLERYGFDRTQHEQIRADLKGGRIGLAQNRLPISTQIQDVTDGDVFDATRGLPKEYHDAGLAALKAGAVAVVTLAAGAGSRWTQGAGTVKALHPFWKLRERHRNFLEVHLAKTKRVSRSYAFAVPHLITTSYMTHEPIRTHLASGNNFGYLGPLHLSPG